MKPQLGNKQNGELVISRIDETHGVIRKAQIPRDFSMSTTACTCGLVSGMGEDMPKTITNFRACVPLETVTTYDLPW